MLSVATGHVIQPSGSRQAGTDVTRGGVQGGTRHTRQAPMTVETPNGLETDTEGRALIAASARIGRDRLLIQGPGGNTSVKCGETMWVKASGKWLSEAEAEDIFVPINWPAYADALRSGAPDAENASAYCTAGYDGGLRPSIETPFHALLPQKIVIHVHCVDTIAWAGRADAQTSIGEVLTDEAWHFVPYIRPGLPLVPGILDGVNKGANVFVLGNHGLVVAGDTVVEATALLDRVRNLLRLEPVLPGTVAVSSLGVLCEGTEYEPVTDPGIAGLAHDSRLLDLIGRGPLYPDHVVFLGVGPSVVAAASAADQIALGEDSAIVVEGQGVIQRRDTTAGARALLICLSDVLRRVDPGAETRHLSREECGALMNWDAEAFRKAQDG